MIIVENVIKLVQALTRLTDAIGLSFSSQTLGDVVTVGNDQESVFSCFYFFIQIREEST